MCVGPGSGPQMKSLSLQSPSLWWHLRYFPPKTFVIFILKGQKNHKSRLNLHLRRKCKCTSSITPVFTGGKEAHSPCCWELRSYCWPPTRRPAHFPPAGGESPGFPRCPTASFTEASHGVPNPLGGEGLGRAQKTQSQLTASKRSLAGVSKRTFGLASAKRHGKGWLLFLKRILAQLDVMPGMTAVLEPWMNTVKMSDNPESWGRLSCPEEETGFSVIWLQCVINQLWSQATSGLTVDEDNV